MLVNNDLEENVWGFWEELLDSKSQRSLQVYNASQEVQSSSSGFTWGVEMFLPLTLAPPWLQPVVGNGAELQPIIGGASNLGVRHSFVWISTGKSWSG